MTDEDRAYDPNGQGRHSRFRHEYEVTNGYSTNTGAGYTDEELEFLKAMDRYKRENRRPYPTFTEVLAVAVSLGYRKVQTDEPRADAA